MKKLAIITVDYNGHADTHEFLASAKRLKIPGEIEAKYFIVDNGSDAPLQVSGAELIQTGENVGFAGGYNRGIRYALQWGADYVAIVNNDVLFADPHLMAKLLAVLQNNPQAGVVSPKILFAPGFEFHKDRYGKSDTGKVIWYAGGHFDWDNVMSVHRGIDEIDHGQFDQVEKTDFVSGCCLMASREALQQVGLFDEKLFAYFEDSDLMQRMAMAGWEKYYCGTTSIYHKVSQTAGIGSILTDYLLTRNRLYFGFKYATPKTKVALAREALRFVLFGRQYQKRGVLDFAFGKFGRPRFIWTNPHPVFPVKLSVVIINYKTLELTLKCLTSIFDNRSGFSKVTGEVILVDNASDDGIAKRVAKEFPQVKFIGSKKNLGFSGGNNLGIDYSLGEYVLLLNSDTEARPNCFPELINAADGLGGLSIMSGRLFFPDGSDQDSVFNLPTVTGAIKEYFFKAKGSYFMYRPEILTRVECAVMACFMIPRRVINAIGKLDEGTFMYFEDVEYCRRAKQNYVHIYFVPRAEFIHHHGASSQKIGHDESFALLKKGSAYYHGRFKYALLWMTLWLGQKVGRIQNPKLKWAKQG